MYRHVPVLKICEMFSRECLRFGLLVLKTEPDPVSEQNEVHSV